MGGPNPAAGGRAAEYHEAQSFAAAAWASAFSSSVIAAAFQACQRRFEPDPGLVEIGNLVLTHLVSWP